MTATALLAALLLLGVGRLPAGTLCIEAESATKLTAPMRVTDAKGQPPPAKTVADASGDQYLEVPEGAGKPPEVGGDALIEFTVADAGTYVLWGRAWWPDGCGNSLGMSIDGAPAFTFGQDATYSIWHWVKAPGKLKQLELAKGRHTLTISNREDGAILDQILLTTNARYVPVGAETPTARAP